MKIREQKKLESLEELMQLNIIDFQRTNGRWDDNISQGIATVANWLINTTVYSLVEIDLTRYPLCGDFPAWTHAGEHEQIGRLYWSFFFSAYGKRSPHLQFSDAPDFRGSYLDNEQVRRNIYGDIGQISVSAFVENVLPNLRLHDLWISVLDSYSQVIVEPLVDLQALAAQAMQEEWGY
jgi:hypothetical protein